MSRSKLDATQIAQSTYDGTLEAVKVAIQSVDMSMELSAADGDNVTAKPDVALVSNTTAISCVGMKTINLYVSGTGTAKVQVSGTDAGATFIDLPSSTTVSGAMSGPLSICARRIQIVFTVGTPTVNLVMQSV